MTERNRMTARNRMMERSKDDGKKTDDSKADDADRWRSASVPKTGDTTEQGRLIMLAGCNSYFIIASNMIYRRKRNK